MDIEIKPLAPGMAVEFFRYFEECAFPPGDPRANCYCLESHVSDEGSYESISERQDLAEGLILSGRMTGYLLYGGGTPVGWCNAGDKCGYQPIMENEKYFSTDCRPGQIKIMYCIDIAEGYQGRGLAALAMERFLADAKAEGYQYAEGYPFAKLDYPWQYRGPVRMYEKLGFTRFDERPGFYIYRKKL